MMIDLFLDLGNPTIKSIKISCQITGGIGSGCSVSGRFDCFSLVALTHITFSHKFINIFFHTILEKITFNLVIGFGKP
jgi:hypothetical protein